MLDLSAQLEDEESSVSGDICQFFGCRVTRDSLRSLCADGDEQVIWTDGASSHNQDQRFRRAGSGIFYGVGHPMNASVMLPGLVQSNQRAELLAVVLSCLRDPRPLDIRTDSEYVCKGANAWMTWCDCGWPHDHADLWNTFAREMRSRATRVCVSWVKGHARRVDVERGRATEEDKIGNDGADALAVAGAALHTVPVEVVGSARQRRQCATSVHKMILAVLQARLRAEREQN